jgi:hypothetical protein
VHRAAALLENAEEQLKRTHPDLKRIVPAGDFRGGCELISDLSLVVEAPHVSEQATITSGSPLKIHLTVPAHFGATLLHATGTGRHYEQLETLASAHGMKLDERGLRRGRKTIARKTEQEIYAALGLPFIEPELREGGDEIARARTHALTLLVTDKNLRGGRRPRPVVVPWGHSISAPFSPLFWNRKTTCPLTKFIPGECDLTREARARPLMQSEPETCRSLGFAPGLHLCRISFRIGLLFTHMWRVCRWPFHL